MDPAKCGHHLCDLSKGRFPHHHTCIWPDRRPRYFPYKREQETSLKTPRHLPPPLPSISSFNSSNDGLSPLYPTRHRIFGSRATSKEDGRNREMAHRGCSSDSTDVFCARTLPPSSFEASNLNWNIDSRRTLEVSDESLGSGTAAAGREKRRIVDVGLQPRLPLNRNTHGYAYHTNFRRLEEQDWLSDSDMKLPCGWLRR